MGGLAIVVQSFTKSDTLQALCESLLKCDSRRQFDLIFWSDSASGSRKEAEYQSKSAEVHKFLKSFSGLNSAEFRSIATMANAVNRGTCKTCQIALDSAFSDHDFAIFTEDDTVFAADALDWFLSMKESPAFFDETVWAIAGESIFFDGREVMPDERFIKAARVYAKTNRLWEQYTAFDFVPSTCFATTRQKWVQFSATRGEPNGDVDLCVRCRTEGKKCLFPIVGRVKDVGMLHPDGYSVLIHTAENVSGLKNCYLMSSEVRPEEEITLDPRLFDGHAGQLFSRSTLLHGFDDFIESASSQRHQAPIAGNDQLVGARQAGIRGDWALALGLWQEIKTSGLATAEAETSIGLCLLKLGRRGEARLAIEHVLSRYPDEAFAQSIMAYLLEADGNFGGASVIWERLSQRGDLPEWMLSSARDGAMRCGPLAASFN